jgi:hypothetical protein
VNADPGVDVDHIDDDPLNNRRSNLRIASRFQNLGNTRRRADNTSGFKGVSWSNRFRYWVASIGYAGAKRHLGCYPTAEQAAHAYDEAAREMFGEFARVNFPQEGELAA